MNQPAWLIEARKLIGLKEIKGSAHEPEILALWEDAGLPFTDDETAWCAGFVGGCLKRGGEKPSGSAAARSYSKWGFDVLKQGVKQIPFGAVVVYSRDPNPAQGHVGFAVGRTPEGNILTLGGNQKDMVSIAPFAAARLVAARWPVEGDLRILQTLPEAGSAEQLSNDES